MARRRAPGALEAEVLAALWAADRSLTPEEVRRQLPGELAYTTVMTILVRLHEKRAVRREALGRAYAYAPLLDEAGLSARRMQALLEGGADRDGVLSRFVASLDENSRSALRKALGPEP